MRPPYERLWGLAKHERDKRLKGQLSDDELLGLVAETYLACSRTFDEQHPPNHGPCRREPQDRLIYYFMRRLVWRLEDHRRWLRRGQGVGEYDGPRGDELEAARQPRSKTALLEMVERAMLLLDDRERTIIELRHWDGASFNVIAAKLGLADRFEASRELDRVHEKLRGLILAEVSDSILGPEEDLGPLEAA